MTAQIFFIGDFTGKTAVGMFRQIIKTIAAARQFHLSEFIDIFAGLIAKVLENIEFGRFIQHGYIKNPAGFDHLAA